MNKFFLGSNLIKKMKEAKENINIDKRLNCLIWIKNYRETNWSILGWGDQYIIYLLIILLF